MLIFSSDASQALETAWMLSSLMSLSTFTVTDACNGHIRPQEHTWNHYLAWYCAATVHSLSTPPPRNASWISRHRFDAAPHSLIRSWHTFATKAPVRAGLRPICRSRAGRPEHSTTHLGAVALAGYFIACACHGRQLHTILILMILLPSDTYACEAQTPCVHREQLDKKQRRIPPKLCMSELASRAAQLFASCVAFCYLCDKACAAVLSCLFPFRHRLGLV